MRRETNHLSRRALVKLAGITVAGAAVSVGKAEGKSPTGSLFDGKTLDGWIQIENSATSCPAAASPIRRLTKGPDATSVFLCGRLHR